MKMKKSVNELLSSVRSGGMNVVVLSIDRTLRLALVMLALALIGGSVSASAQETWEVDGQHSVARLAIGSGSNALEVGLARVVGNLVFESRGSDDPTVHLTLRPENGELGNFPEMTFTSRRSAMTSDGKLLVTGDLFITRIERSAAMDANEAYHGAEYGEPVVSTATEEVRLTLSVPSLLQNGTMHFSGSTLVSREAFPQLVDTLRQDSWPTTLVNDQKCVVPSATGEDFSGASCSGSELASVSNREIATGGSGGEGYYGFQPAVVPNPDQATMALDITLKQVSSARAIAGAGVSAGK
jgi:hypothetical protein